MSTRNKWMLNLFYVPALIIFFIFVVYPFFNGIRISFTNWNGYLPQFKYVGLYNYKLIFTDKTMLQVFINTIIYGFGSTIFQNILGLAYAVFLNSKFPGRGIIRTIIYIPVMIAPLIMGYIIFFLLQYSGGALNDARSLFGLVPVNWLGAPWQSITIIVIANTLQYAGISMVIYLAGLQNIPAMYKEAAEIDGASSWAVFRFVNLPLLMPAITSSVMINLIGGLKLFDIIRALLPLSPTTGAQSLSSYLVYQYFNVQRAGYSAVIGIFTFIFILIISIIAMRYFDNREEQIL